jgi:hypothetical protein
MPKAYDQFKERYKAHFLYYVNTYQAIFQLSAAVTITDDRTANINLCLTLMALSSEDSTGPRFIRFLTYK